MIKGSSFVALTLLLNFFTTVSAQKCIKGDIEYSSATYSDELFISKYYGNYIDSLLGDEILKYYCNTSIKHLPEHSRHQGKKKGGKANHGVEPLFVDLKTFDGVYGKRIWPVNSKLKRVVRSPRYRCGFFHYLFIISDNRYIPLTRDSAENEKILRKHLSKTFSEAELLRMTSYFTDDRICDNFTFLPPFCLKRNDQVLFDVSNLPKKRGDQISDKDANTYLVKQLRDNLWMTNNLKLEIPGSCSYDSLEKNISQYGRLYTWDAAKQGCASLGESWRLPTKDEWFQLSKLYANGAEDSVTIRKKSFQPMLAFGPNLFNAQLGGNRNPDGTFSRTEAHGFYWSSTEDGNSHVWYANFAKGSQALYIQNGGEKERSFSVRCIKSIN